MKKNMKNLLVLGLFSIGLFSTGCMSNNKYTDLEKVLYSILTQEELVKVLETNSDKKIGDKTLKDVEIVLNLDGLSKSIAYEKSLEKVTTVLGVVDSVFEEDINSYIFKVNSSKLDIYGNKQKVRVIEVSIDKDTVDKINFENFDYLNLDKICKVTKFKYLTEKES